MSEYQATRRFSLKSFDAVGFDMDDCLANYNYQPLFSTIYDSLVQHLSKRIEYEASLQDVDKKYVPFCCKGLIADIRRGNILKVASDGLIVRATHGTKRLSRKEISSEYEGRVWQQHKWFLNVVEHLKGEYYMMESIFDIPAGDVYAQLVDTFDEKQGRDITNYSGLWDDVVDAHAHMFPDDKLADNTVTRLKNNIGVYIRVCSPSVRRWLKRLRHHKKAVFLLTNSYSSICSVILQHILGNNWETYFDFVVCRANKPTFYKCNPRDELKKVGDIYKGGNTKQLEGMLEAITGKPNPKVVYFGDSTMNDVFPSKHFAKWSTVQILNDPSAGCNRVTSRDIDRCETRGDTKETAYWGSYITDTRDGITTRTLWDAAITRYADVAIQSIDCIADLNMDHEFEAFTPGVQNGSGYYVG